MGVGSRAFAGAAGPNECEFTLKLSNSDTTRQITLFSSV